MVRELKCKRKEAALRSLVSFLSSVKPGLQAGVSEGAVCFFRE